METWQYLLAVLLPVTLLLAVRSSAAKRRRAKQLDFDRKLETVLQPKETVKVICPDRQGRWILTSKRLLRETKGGFAALDLKTVKRVQGTTKEGKSTTVPAKMVSLTVKAEKDQTIPNTSAEFETLARQLQDKVKKQNQKKKAQKEKQKKAE